MLAYLFSCLNNMVYRPLETCKPCILGQALELPSCGNRIPKRGSDVLMSECQGWDWKLIVRCQILPSVPSTPLALPLNSHRNLAAQHMGKEDGSRLGRQDKGVDTLETSKMRWCR